MSGVRVRPAGDRAVLLEPADPEHLGSLVDRLRADPIDGVADLLPAARTVLLTLGAGVDTDTIEKRVRAMEFGGPAAGRRSDEATVTIPVHYDGPDLDAVAEFLGIDRDAVVHRHTAAVWECAFIGFAPGFGYLRTPDSDLTVPRRDQARTGVPAGSVALAGGYSAVYPRRSPGGWQLIGRTGAVLWDPERPNPALLRAGARIRFVEAPR
ncbi:MAG: allophanate hydrolase subunit 1 [Nocardia sp.]|nr:allophanate hydrolase subunit 1 [Nocardia sp.]